MEFEKKSMHHRRKDDPDNGDDLLARLKGFSSTKDLICP
jgi:hypothetical protein